MSPDFRVRYKKGDIEIEIQATDKAYVNSMLDRLLMISTESRVSPPPKQQHRIPSSGAKGRTPDDTNVDAVRVSNAINDTENHAQIEKNILNKGNRLNKILMAFHFAHDCGYKELTTGDVEKITDQVGIKISKSSASHCISDNRKFFSAGAARQQGAIIPYKLNRQGEIEYQSIFAGTEA